MNELSRDSSCYRLMLLDWFHSNRIVLDTILYYLSPMEGKIAEEKEQIARNALDELQKMTDVELSKIQLPPLSPEDEQRFAEYKAWQNEQRNRPELNPEDPAAIHLEELRQMICEQLHQARDSRVDLVLLYDLNTAEKVDRFSRWIEANMDGDTLTVTENKILEVSYLIDRGKSIGDDER